MDVIRSATVAGAFYSGQVETLEKQLTWCFQHPLGPGKPQPPAVANRTPSIVIAPHAGYLYSGPVAAHAYRSLVESGAPDLIVILGPNHRLLGAPIAVSGADAWRTPLGTVRVDLDAAEALSRECTEVEIDDLAHRMEHSVEVQVPFVQFALGKSCRLLPIVTYDQRLESSSRLGTALAQVLRGKNVAMVATSDFTHYETHQSASRKDRFALQAIEELDPEALVRAIERYGVSMCGPGPVLAAIVVARSLGATRGRTLQYATSGQFCGDYEQVVGYGALALL